MKLDEIKSKETRIESTEIKLDEMNSIESI